MQTFEQFHLMKEFLNWPERFASSFKNFIEMRRNDSKRLLYLNCKMTCLQESKMFFYLDCKIVFLQRQTL